MKQRLPFAGLGWVSTIPLLAFLASCDAGGGGVGGDAATTSTKATGVTGSTGSSAQGGATATSTAAQFMTGSTGAGTTCNAGPDEDQDGDGYSINQGDCNDCDANVNPNALEVIVTDPDPMTGMVPPPADEDCDGTVDNPPAATCDDALPIDGSAADAAKAIEICKTSSGVKDWGLVDAQYVRANGNPYSSQNPVQHGILAKWGDNVMPRAGKSVVAISSGRARLPGQPGSATGRNMTSLKGSPPAFFPQDVPTCAGGTSINDDVALQVYLRAPSNATGYKFDFRFNTFEYPQWICTAYNDQFVAIVDPEPMGSIHGNISFDSQNNPVSVNIAFFDVCNTCNNFAQNCMGTCPMAPNPCCPSGDMELAGTGFDNSFTAGGQEGGGTSWLQTTAPIHGGDAFAIRFAIWDTGDHNLDSTAVVDNFQWIASGGTVMVGTTEPPQ
jgi:hypothetical protein